MTILITGGTSKTAIPLIAQLKETNTPHLVASHRALPNTVRLDWHDPTTFPTALTPPDGTPPITAVYLVAPVGPTPGPLMNPFIDAAVARGVQRFVLIGGGSLTRSAPWLGEVWRHLAAHAERTGGHSDGGVTFAVLRPTWFLENLTGAGWVEGIRARGELATGAGAATPLTWISAADIAGVAARALALPAAELQEAYDVKGAELVSFERVAAKLSRLLGREIRPVELSPDENRRRFLEAGQPEFLAGLLASLEERHKTGEMAHIAGLEPNDAPRMLGRPPKTVDQFLEENKQVWM